MASRSMAWPPAMPSVPIARASVASISTRCSGLRRAPVAAGAAPAPRRPAPAAHRRRGSRCLRRTPVAGRPAAAQVVVVHGRQVVVDQAVGVDQFDRGCRRIEPPQRRAEGLAGHVDQHRPQALAAAQDAVAHRLAQPRRGRVVARELLIEAAFDALLIGSMIAASTLSRERRAPMARSARRSFRRGGLEGCAGVDIFDRDGVATLQQQLHLLLRSCERALAFTREPHALLEGAQRLIERQVAATRAASPALRAAPAPLRRPAPPRGCRLRCHRITLAQLPVRFNLRESLTGAALAHRLRCD